jgi:V8-like Glu-specific endopeptidase
MDLRKVFSDTAVKEEFLDRFDELAASAPEAATFEGDGDLRVEDAADVADRIADGSFEPGARPGVEAIIERFTRPVYLIQQSRFDVPPDDFPDSEEIKSRLQAAEQALAAIIPSAGRIDVRNHRLDWLGTAWMVAPNVAVTNRHVAGEIAERDNGTFVFKQNLGAAPVSAVVDWRHEHQQPEESRFRVEEVIWIEPPGSVDVALLQLTQQGESGDALPPVIELMTEEELSDTGTESWVAVVGYPAFDSRNDTADQQRIFDGIFNVKRLAPGQVTAVAGDDLLNHDATTLGGNSGSVVVELAGAKAMGLHFGGIEGERNMAVQAPRVRQILDERLN